MDLKGKTWVLFLSAILIAAAAYLAPKHTSPNGKQNNDTSNQAEKTATTTDNQQLKNIESIFLPPIADALSRITKKPFGIKVSPGNSPVSPERFSGYHTGVDFETTSEEADADVSVSAICSGTLAIKKFATGYGGVVVEKCMLDGALITVIYGHLNLSSISIKTGDKIAAGEKIGVLGRGYSRETDGERKHLHLGIHKGSSINILGYVQNEKDLANWIDIKKYLK